VLSCGEQAKRDSENPAKNMLQNCKPVAKRKRALETLEFA
jgi:hypothetical protein